MKKSKLISASGIHIMRLVHVNTLSLNSKCLIWNLLKLKLMANLIPSAVFFPFCSPFVQSVLMAGTVNGSRLETKTLNSFEDLKF